MAPNSRMRRTAVCATALSFCVLGGLTLPGVHADTATPPTAIANPSVSADPVSDSVGAIEGQFRVNESGQATYNIPLYTPAGVAGVAPQLSLNYDSMAGTGTLGQGWRLGGLSGITRCRQTLHQDGKALPISWNDDDRFCLDGQRLIVKTGTYGALGATYRTEIDNYGVITAKADSPGAPAYFEMKAKDGSVTKFGHLPSTRQVAHDTTGTPTSHVYGWMLGSFEDSAGNSINYTYAADVEGHRITSIDYAYSGGVKNASVVFKYQAKANHSSGVNDSTKHYVGGYLFKSNRILTNIEVHNDEVKVSGGLELVRDYRLKYQDQVLQQSKNLLISVTECAGTASNSVCLEPTTFTWASQIRNYYGGSTTATLPTNSDDVSSQRLLDINGDGRMDLVWHVVSYQVTSPGLFPVDHQWWYYSLANSSGTGYSTPQMFRDQPGKYSEAFAWQVLDYNADGLDDVMLSVNDQLRIYLSTGSGFNASTGNYVDTGILLDDDSDLQLLDLNSDGMPDLIYEYGNNQYLRMMERQLDAGTGTWKMQFSATVQYVGDLLNEPADTTINGVPVNYSYQILKGSEAAAGDFNGDGRLDVAAVKFQGGICNFAVCYSTKEYIFVTLSEDLNGDYQLEQLNFQGSVIGDKSQWRAADFNGDGLSDIIVEQGSQSAANHTHYIWKAYLSNGKEFVELADIGMLGEDELLQVVDYNVDGAMDVVYRVGGNLAYRLFNPRTQVFEPQVINYSLAVGSGLGEPYFFGDSSGDGILDYHHVTPDNFHTKNGYGFPDAITAIDNGLGSVTEITYSPATDTEVYKVRDDAEDEFWDLPLWTQSLGKQEDEVVFDIRPSFRLVRQVEGTAPRAHATNPGAVDTAAKSVVTYAYKGAKLQAGGRGFLGFAEINSYDLQSEILSVTTYRQDFPFIGAPRTTEQYQYWGGFVFTLLNSSTTWWSFQNWDSSPAKAHAVAPYRPYRWSDLETTYDLNTTNEIAYTVSERTQDDWGNVLTTSNQTYSPGDHNNPVSEIKTDNTYYDAGLGVAYSEEFGRLSESKITHTRGNDSVERKTTFTYYSSGAKKGLLHIETLDPGGANELATTYTYDGNGNRLSASVTGDDGNGSNQTRTTRWAYDSDGRNVDRTYESSGTTALSAPSGGTAGELLVSNVLGRDRHGQPTRVQDLHGVETLYQYGDLGRLYHTYTDTGTWQTVRWKKGVYGHCPTGTSVTIVTTTAEGQETRQCLDAVNRPIKSSKRGFGSNQLIFQETEYDSSGRALRQSVPHLAAITGVNIKWTTNTYDSLGRVTQVSHADGSQTATAYNDRTVTVTNALGQTQTEQRNEMGELTLVTDELGSTVAYVYDATGNLKKTSTTTTLPTAQSLDVVMTYDAYGRKISMDDPDMGSWAYTYNAFGELVTQTDANGYVSEMTYDMLGRMVTRKDYWSAGGQLATNSTWSYDHAGIFGVKAGRLIASNVVDYDSGGTKTGQEFKVFQYDSAGRSTGHSAALLDGQGQGPTLAQTVTYDEHGRVFQSFDIAGDGWGEEYSYNDRGYMHKVLEARYTNASNRTTYLEVKAMDAFGNVIEQDLGSARTLFHTYDAANGRLKNIGASAGAGFDQQDLALVYDAVGNLVSRHDKRTGYDQKERFCYDDLNRLVQSHTGALTGSCTGTNQLQYDGLGNITLKDGNSYSYGAFNTSAANDAGPHAVTLAGTTAYTYDNNGNMTAGDGRSVLYTAYNKPYEITKGTTAKAEYHYGIDRGRYKRIDTVNGQVTKTWYVGNTELVERPSGSREIKRRVGGYGLVTHQIDSNDAVTSTQTQYLLKDHLGSVLTVLTANGAIDQEMSFDAWGQRRNVQDWDDPYGIYLPMFNVLNTTRGFTGHEMVDAVGLIHMNGRVYDPHLGRFLQADPFIQAPSDTQSYNRYSYVRNNPLKYTDPSGYIFGIDDVLIAVIVEFVVDFVVASAYMYAADAVANEIGRWFDGSGASIPGVSGSAFGSGSYGATSSSYQGMMSSQCQSTAGSCGGYTGQSQSAKIEQIASSVLGDTYSDQTGGKFSNGAITQSFEISLSYTQHMTSAEVLTTGAELIVPGYDVYVCSVEACDATGWGLAAIGIIPGAGKLVATGGKLVRQIYRAAVKNRKTDVHQTVYEDVTKPGSKLPNRSTDVSKSEFEDNLIDSGYTRSTSKDGAVTLLQKGNKRYTTRDNSRSTEGPTVEVFVDDQATSKIRVRK